MRFLQGCQTDEGNLAEHLCGRQKIPCRLESSSTLADYDRGAESPRHPGQPKEAQSMLERRRDQSFPSQLLTAAYPWKDLLATKKPRGKDNQVLQLVISPLDATKSGTPTVTQSFLENKSKYFPFRNALIPNAIQTIQNMTLFLKPITIVILRTVPATREDDNLQQLVTLGSLKNFQKKTFRDTLKQLIVRLVCSAAEVM